MPSGRGRAGAAGGPPRRSTLGEATLIAGVTALAYLVALAFRVGGLMRLQLPLSLATVRLTDAAIAGLVVLVGGFLIFICIDAIESWRQGALRQLWRLLLLITVAALLLTAGIVVLAFLLTLWEYAGAAWAGAAMILIGLVMWFLLAAVKRAFSDAPVSGEHDLALTRALERHPAVAGSIVVAAVLCFGSFYFGVVGISLGRVTYLRTEGGSEIALSLSEDRAVLAGIEPTESEAATLTGSLRVVPLPSDELVFSTRRVYELQPSPR